MDNRRSYLAFLAVVAGGLAIGVVLAALWDDGDTEPEADDPSSTTTTSTTSTSTTTTTTTTPTAGITDAPLADMNDGYLVGFPVPSAMEPVERQLRLRFGPPDWDPGWTVGCPFSGNTEPDERHAAWGDLSVDFQLVDGEELVVGWSYNPGGTTFAEPSPPSPVLTDVVLPPDVAWGQTMAQVSATVDQPPEAIDEFLTVWIFDGDALWSADGLDVSAPFNQVNWGRQFLWE